MNHTGELGRLYVRGKENVHKKFLIQAAACNLALLMRSMYGSGKPRAAHDRIVDAILTILALMKAVEDILTASSAMFYREHRISPSRAEDRANKAGRRKSRGARRESERSIVPGKAFN